MEKQQAASPADQSPLLLDSRLHNDLPNRECLGLCYASKNSVPRPSLNLPKSAASVLDSDKPAVSLLLGGVLIFTNNHTVTVVHHSVGIGTSSSLNQLRCLKRSLTEPNVIHGPQYFPIPPVLIQVCADCEPLCQQSVLSLQCLDQRDP
jgi:hypothetical protein